MTYDSLQVIESRALPGVRLSIRRMSFAGRIELMRSIRELSHKAEFLAAGTTHSEQMDAALLRSDIDSAYLRWGLKEVLGLELDGAPATPESVIVAGPESLVREALEAIRAQCGLSEDERKN